MKYPGDEATTWSEITEQVNMMDILWWDLPSYTILLFWRYMALLVLEWRVDKLVVDKNKLIYQD